MKFYKIRHKPTGLYWQGGTNFWPEDASLHVSKVGKTYSKLSVVRSLMKDIHPTSDFEIVVFETKEIGVVE